MGILEELQQQGFGAVAQAGAAAAQGAVATLQSAMPQLIEQVGQQVQEQVPALQQVVKPVVRDLGQAGGEAVRDAATGFDSMTVVGLGAGALAALGLVIFAATRAGSVRDRAAVAVAEGDAFAASRRR